MMWWLKRGHGPMPCSDSFLILHCKLTRTARALKAWACRLVDDLKLPAAFSSKIIGQLDSVMDDRNLTDSERTLRVRGMLKMNLLGNNPGPAACSLATMLAHSMAS